LIVEYCIASLDSLLFGSTKVTMNLFRKMMISKQTAEGMA